MKERPIIFSTTMIQAILAGNKTMTRRVVKKNEAGRVQLKGRNWHIDDPNATLACPYGQPGDMLWVRETWADVNTPDGPAILYRASGDYQHWHEEDLLSGAPEHRWKPSIHMPKWAARIWLKVSGVRVERLQDIIEADVVKEGCDPIANFKIIFFKYLWDELNKKRSYGWSKNPLVWVVEFELVDRPKAANKF